MNWKTERWLLTSLVCFTAALWIPRFRGPIDIRWDGGTYYVLGTSLAEGRGYRMLNEPGDIRAVQYPPGLPLFVAAHQWLLGTTDFLVIGPWLHLTYLLLALGLTAAVYFLARAYLSPAYAVLMTSLCAAPYLTICMSNMLFAELPYTLLATLFLHQLCRADPRHGMIAGTLAIAAYLFRTAGLALLITWVADSLFHRRFKQATVRATIAMIPIFAWQGYIHSVVASEAYRHPAYAYQRADYQYSNVPYTTNGRLRNPFAPELGRTSNLELAERLVTNLAYIPESMGQAISTLEYFGQQMFASLDKTIGYPLHLGWLSNSLFMFLGSLSIAGTALLAWRKQWPVVLFISISIALVCLTPWREQYVRYLSALTPAFILALVALLSEAMKWSAARTGPTRWLGAGLMVFTLFVIVPLDLATVVTTMSRGISTVICRETGGRKAIARLLFYTAPWRSLDGAIDWVRRNGSAGDIVACTTPPDAYVFTGLKAILYPLEGDPSRALRLLDSASVRFVITDELEYPAISQRYLAPAVEVRPDLWKLEYESAARDPGSFHDSISRVYERVR